MNSRTDNHFASIVSNLEIWRRHEQESALWSRSAEVHAGLRKAHDVGQCQYDDGMLARLERVDHGGDPSDFISIDKSHTVVPEGFRVNVNCKKQVGNRAMWNRREATCGVWLKCGG